MKLVLRLEVPKGEEDVVRHLVAGKEEHLLVDYLRTEAYNCNTPTAHVVEHGDDWAGNMQSLLGRRVRTTIDYDKPMVVEGELIQFDEGGEVAIRADDGFIGWSWPNLETVEVK